MLGNRVERKLREPEEGNEWKVIVLGNLTINRNTDVIA